MKFKFGTSLRSIASQAQIINELVTGLRDVFPDTSKLHAERVEIILEICRNTSEMCLARNVATLDQDAISLNVYRDLFNSQLNSTEEQFVVSVIAYLRNSGAITKGRFARLVEFLSCFFRTA